MSKLWNEVRTCFKFKPLLYSYRVDWISFVEHWIVVISKDFGLRDTVDVYDNDAAADADDVNLNSDVFSYKTFSNKNYR